MTIILFKNSKINKKKRLRDELERVLRVYINEHTPEEVKGRLANRARELVAINRGRVKK